MEKCKASLKTISSDKEYELLSNELEEAMGHVSDEQDVQKIREIVKKMEELHPEEEPTYKSTEYYWELFESRYLQDALKAAELVHEEGEGVRRKRKKKENLIRAVRFAVLFIVLLVAVNVTTVVFAGINIFEPIISWTENVFSKKGGTNTGNEGKDSISSSNCSSLEEVEAYLDIYLYKPDISALGYAETGFYLDDLSGLVFIGINYDDNGTDIQYSISIYLTPHTFEQMIEKIDEDVKIYAIDGIDIYVIKNVNWYVISWQDDNIDYIATGFNDISSAEGFIQSLRK